MSKETKLNSKAAAEMLGEARIMNCGEIAFIVNYANYNDITVKFKTTGELVKSTYQCFKNGSIKSHFTPSVYCVGIIGNEKTKDENGKIPCGTDAPGDFISWFCSKKTVYAWQMTGKRHDIGNLESLEEARQVFLK